MKTELTCFCSLCTGCRVDCTCYGTVLAEEGELVPGEQVWLLPQLLEGMTGASEN